MTKLERRLHKIIESAILDHGYVLRTFDARTWGTINWDNRDCCIKGAVALVTGCVAVGYELGISPDEMNAIESGFEVGRLFKLDSYDRRYPDLYRLGEELRERYVVQE
jgi:hypothetical protein